MSTLTPKPTIGIVNRCKALRLPVAVARRLVKFVAAAEGQTLGAIDVAVVDADEIAELNERYLRHAEPTDVLSFDLSEGPGPGISAQIVVCGDVAIIQGPAHGLGADEELKLYVIHGLLHLMGYDDTHPRAAAKMRARQEELLAEFGEREAHAR